MVDLKLYPMNGVKDAFMIYSEPEKKMLVDGKSMIVRVASFMNAITVYDYLCYSVHNTIIFGDKHMPFRSSLSYKGDIDYEDDNLVSTSIKAHSILDSCKINNLASLLPEINTYDVKFFPEALNLVEAYSKQGERALEEFEKPPGILSRMRGKKEYGTNIPKALRNVKMFLIEFALRRVPLELDDIDGNDMITVTLMGDVRESEYR